MVTLSFQPFCNFKLCCIYFNFSVCQSDSLSACQFVSLPLLNDFSSFVSIPGQPKICYPGGKFPGINPKNLPAAFGGRKFFSPLLSPRGTKSKFFFTHGIPIDYSRGSFKKKISLPLTPQGSFSEKFEIFGPFLAKLGGE